MLNKAIAQENTADRRMVIFQRWVADKKLRYWGLNENCTLKNQSKKNGSALLYLVEKYGNEAVNNEAVLNLISSFIKQGCNINEYDSEINITAFHSAIMLAESSLLVEFLLKNGANIDVPIKRNNSAQGKNAIGWAEVLLKTKEDKEQPTNTIKKIILLLKENQSSN